MAEIQGNIAKRDKRNAVSRRLHKKEDDEAIASWRLDLNRVLRVLKVRSIAFASLLLTPPSQTELKTNARAIGSDVHEVLSPNTTVSDVRYDPTNTNIISGVHQDVSKSHPDVHTVKSSENKYGQNPRVSILCTVVVTEESLTGT